MTTTHTKSIKQRIADFVASKKKAIAAGVSQLVTTAIAWLGLHVGFSVDAATATWTSATIGSLVSAGVVWLVRNELR